MKKNTAYNLLFNGLWLVDPEKIKKFNSGFNHNNSSWHLLETPDIKLSHKTSFTKAVKAQDQVVHELSPANNFKEAKEYLDLNSNVGLKSNISSINSTFNKNNGSFNQKAELFSQTQTLKHPSLSTSTATCLYTKDDLIFNWDSLQEEVSNCTKCKLCHKRKHIVLERGNRAAKWLFVGEGPGEQEDLKGLPFVGPSGQLLDKMIAAMKLDAKTEVYICNVVKCRPPYNRNPDNEEINLCKNYLFSQIELVSPSIIIALGRFAAQTLLGSSVATSRLRNQVHKFNLLTRTVPLVITYHPAYLLRNPSAKKEVWEDLQLALKTI